MNIFFLFLLACFVVALVMYIFARLVIDTPESKKLESKISTQQRIKVLESMTCIERDGFVFRVWRAEELDMKWNATTNSDLVSEALKYDKALDIFKALSEMPRVSAVEITGKQSKNGLVAYTEWP